MFKSSVSNQYATGETLPDTKKLDDFSYHKLMNSINGRKKMTIKSKRLTLEPIALID
jgi:hypothetical protein